MRTDQSKPDWWEPMDRVTVKPKRPEPEWLDPPPGWIRGFPERTHLLVAEQPGRWVVRCKLCQRTLDSPRKKVGVGRVWLYHLAHSERHVRLSLFTESFYLGREHDRHLANVVANALKIGAPRVGSFGRRGGSRAAR